MTPKEFWTAAYLAQAAKGMVPLDCLKAANWHTGIFEERWPETPTENTPATPENLPVVDKTAVEPIQELDKYEWRLIEEFSNDDAFKDCKGLVYLWHLNDFVNTAVPSDNLRLRTDAKYLARCKPSAPATSIAAADFEPKWEWAKRTDIPNQWDNDTHEDVTVHQEPRNPNAWYFYYRGDVPASPSYPTLQAAQIEAERYWKLYVNPARITTTETTTERRPT